MSKERGGDEGDGMQNDSKIEKRRKEEAAVASKRLKSDFLVHIFRYYRREYESGVELNHK